MINYSGNMESCDKNQSSYAYLWLPYPIILLGKQGPWLHQNLQFSPRSPRLPLVRQAYLNSPDSVTHKTPNQTFCTQKLNSWTTRSAEQVFRTCDNESLNWFQSSWNPVMFATKSCVSNHSLFAPTLPHHNQLLRSSGSFAPDKLLKFLANLDSANGLDGIHSRVLKSCSAHLALPLFALFTLIYNR